MHPLLMPTPATNTAASAIADMTSIDALSIVVFVRIITIDVLIAVDIAVIVTNGIADVAPVANAALIIAIIAGWITKAMVPHEALA